MLLEISVLQAFHVVQANDVMIAILEAEELQLLVFDFFNNTIYALYGKINNTVFGQAVCNEYVRNNALFDFYTCVPNLNIFNRTILHAKGVRYVYVAIFQDTIPKSPVPCYVEQRDGKIGYGFVAEVQVHIPASNPIRERCVRNVVAINPLLATEMLQKKCAGIGFERAVTVGKGDHQLIACRARGGGLVGDQFGGLRKGLAVGIVERLVAGLLGQEQLIAGHLGLFGDRLKRFVSLLDLTIGLKPAPDSKADADDGGQRKSEIADHLGPDGRVAFDRKGRKPRIERRERQDRQQDRKSAKRRDALRVLRLRRFGRVVIAHTNTQTQILPVAQSAKGRSGA